MSKEPQIPDELRDEFKAEIRGVSESAGVELGMNLSAEKCLGEGITDDELAHAPEWDRPMLEMLQGVSDPESDPSRALVSYSSSGTPEFVLERIREAIMDGAMFSQFDSIPSSRLMDLRQEFADALGTDDFTLDSITESLMEFEADLDRDAAEKVARTETTAIMNRSREIAYEEKGEGDERFYWTGSLDARTTDTCAYLIAGTNADLDNPGAFSGLPRSDGTNPFEGGEPMEKKDLKEHIRNVAQADPQISTQPREWTPHIQCRSTFVLEPDAGI